MLHFTCFSALRVNAELPHRLLCLARSWSYCSLQEAVLQVGGRRGPPTVARGSGRAQARPGWTGTTNGVPLRGARAAGGHMPGNIGRCEAYLVFPSVWIVELACLLVCLRGW